MLKDSNVGIEWITKERFDKFNLVLLTQDNAAILLADWVKKHDRVRFKDTETDCSWLNASYATLLIVKLINIIRRTSWTRRTTKVKSFIVNRITQEGMRIC